MGEQSFNSKQLEKLKENMNVEFYTQKEELNSDEFIDIVKEVLTFQEETICTVECFLGITLSEATIDSLKRISVIDDAE